VWAFGGGRAASQPDSAVSDREEDWLSGDTLRAEFTAPDTATARRSELEHLTAFGSARAFYHTDQRAASGPRGLNYSRGRRIDIAMREAKVHTVDIVGLVDGVYLEPLPPVADTTRADSLRADPLRPDSLRADSLRADSLRADSVRSRATRPDSTAAQPRRTRPAPAPAPPRPQTTPRRPRAATSP